MKVQMSEQELREVLRQLRLCRDGKVLLGEVELNVRVPESKACEAQSEALSPEEQIRRNPKLAFDGLEPPPSDEEMITELLRWFHRPEDAGGMNIDIPKEHPCGFGGQTVYIPKYCSVQTDLTVTFGGKQWNVSHVPDVLVGQTLWLDVDPDGGVVARHIHAAGKKTAYTLTERNVD